MKPMLTFYDLLPALFLVIQTLVFLISTISALRFMKILQLPYAGMEYPKVTIAAAVLLSVMLISLADIDGVVQSVKTFHNYNEGFYRNLFVKISQFLLIIILSVSFLGLLCFTAMRIIPGFRKSADTENDMPGAVLKAIVIIIIAVLLYACAKAVIEPITPRYINFI